MYPSIYPTNPSIYPTSFLVPGFLVFEGPSRPHKATGPGPTDSPSHPHHISSLPESQPVAARSDVNHKYRHRLLSYANNKLAQVDLGNTCCQYTRSAHLINTSYQHMLSTQLSTHLINTSIVLTQPANTFYQPILSTRPLTPLHHTMPTHPISSPCQPTLSPSH